MNLEIQIYDAFGKRKQPDSVVIAGHPATSIYQDALHFSGRDWRDTTAKEWKTHSDAVFGFSPDAFCYFLPGMIIAEIQNSNIDLIVTTSIVNMLDRSPDKSMWDFFFEERFTLLTRKECQCLQQWIIWRAEHISQCDDHSVMRSYETLEVLAEGTTKRARPHRPIHRP